MGRRGMLPAMFARIHPLWDTPHISATAAFLVICLGLLLPTDLVFLFIASSIPTLLKYLSTCVCAFVIARSRPDIFSQARFHLSRPTVMIWSVLGGLCAIGIVLTGIETDWRPYLLVLAWLTIGLVFWRSRLPKIA
jgi:APA family basic amino acid/polyamine antiporter